MAIDPRKRQKKLERRQQKAKAKAKVARSQDPRDLVVRIEKSVAAPILHCCTTDTLWGQGIANVLVSRELTSGNVAYVIFLVDVYCLGVKNVLFDIVSRSRYDFQTVEKVNANVTLEPAAARKLIDGVIDYAEKLGFQPHRDYWKVAPILGDIDTTSCSTEFTYGKDGKPFFIAGPHDSPARCRHIIDRLTESCGADGFTVVMPNAFSQTGIGG